MPDLDFFRRLPYRREWVTRDDDGDRYFVVRLVDIPGVYGYGGDRHEAVRHLREAFDDYVTWRLDEDLPIPEPSGPHLTSERPVFRLTASAVRAPVSGTRMSVSLEQVGATETRGSQEGFEHKLDCSHDDCQELTVVSA
jgi:predicted RNase H-like HicB family nuclease